MRIFPIGIKSFQNKVELFDENGRAKAKPSNLTLWFFITCCFYGQSKPVKISQQQQQQRLLWPSQVCTGYLPCFQRGDAGCCPHREPGLQEFSTWASKFPLSLHGLLSLEPIVMQDVPSIGPDPLITLLTSFFKSASGSSFFWVGVPPPFTARAPLRLRGAVSSSLSSSWPFPFFPPDPNGIMASNIPSIVFFIPSEAAASTFPSSSSASTANVFLMAVFATFSVPPGKLLGIICVCASCNFHTSIKHNGMVLVVSQRHSFLQCAWRLCRCGTVDCFWTARQEK